MSEFEIVSVLIWRVLDDDAFDTRVVAGKTLCIDHLLVPCVRLLPTFGYFLLKQLLELLTKSLALVVVGERSLHLPLRVICVVVQINPFILRLAHWRTDQIPDHKRERGGVAEIHNTTLF
jgi:hypothetical protein